MTRRVQVLVSAMASFDADRAAGGTERQTIQPVHRADPMLLSPALV